MERTIKLDVYRYRPDWDRPTLQPFEVPFREDWVVLDALNYIKDVVDGSLSFRWSCRMGVCGSCGMMVNGRPELTCHTFLRDCLPGPIRIEPLQNFAVERDLIVDIEPFMQKLQAVKPWLVRQAEQPLAQGEYLQSPGQLAAYRQFSMCINCTLCYAACPVVGRAEDFLGPAALALAQRYNLDSRDQGRKERHAIMFQHEGIWDCTFVGECSAVCPKHVDPAGVIQQAKLVAARDAYRSLVMPWSRR
ncbi:MAG: succinate dehydrogenase/fumarate reductase iron-sulfur subunit [Actinobacteria bacterium]|nr:succinate dehydrogenase/fumarate reductase iron-sulfur subunit [Actinomycetota bacterium]